MKVLYDYICDELHEIEEKAARGKVPMDEMKYGDMLAHFGKNLEKMMEGEEGYSERYMYDDGYSMGRGSYARGRGRNAKRDSMGRYSGDGYSRNYDGSYDGNYRGGNYRRGGYSRDDAKQEYMENLRRMMDEAPDENTRMSIQRMMENMER